MNMLQASPNTKQQDTAQKTMQSIDKDSKMGKKKVLQERIAALKKPGGDTAITNQENVDLLS